MQKSGVGGGAVAAPTGCFKCGRPGHWSRDCPSSAPNTNPSPNHSSGPSFFPSSKSSQSSAKLTAAKKVPKTRPKLTPDLLLSDDGLGYVLRHFPPNFKYHGRGHEVRDLGSLIGLYQQWHSHLIPYYSFDQFVHKVEQVGATRRVRLGVDISFTDGKHSRRLNFSLHIYNCSTNTSARCIAELRERVARGGDPTKLHEPPTEPAAPDDCERDLPLETHDAGADMVDLPLESHDADADMVDPPLESHDADDIQEEMFDEIYKKATEDASQAPQSMAASKINHEHVNLEAPQNQVACSTVNGPSQIQITEEQRARMEANRLKALERAAARVRILQGS